MARAQRQGSEVSVALFDVDGFSALNEKSGSRAGDHAGVDPTFAPAAGSNGVRAPPPVGTTWIVPVSNVPWLKAICVPSGLKDGPESKLPAWLSPSSVTRCTPVPSARTVSMCVDPPASM